MLTHACDAAAAARSARRRVLVIIAVAVALPALAWLGWHLLLRGGRVSTSNAYVMVDSAQVTPLVAGAVREVRVVNSQAVRRGDILVVLDDADQRLALEAAKAGLAMAEQRYRQARANAEGARGRLAGRSSETDQAQARLAETDASLERARADLDRREALAVKGFVSGEQLTNARTAFRMAQAARDAAGAAVRSARGGVASATGDLAASAALVDGVSPSTAPELVAARARLAQARLDLDRTVIRAAVDGVVVSRQVQVGQRIAAGTPMMTLVPIADAYVEANFKETQLKGVRAGHPVLLTSDFYGDRVVYHGRVTGFAGGTGAAFSLIPPQNATGNWIKVVQRLPVRVALDPKELAANPLRAGLSMEATIDTRQ